MGLIAGTGAACGDDDPAPQNDTATVDTTTGTDTATEQDTATEPDTETDTATADTATGTDTAAEQDTATVDTTEPAGEPFDGPHAVFAAKCTPCHSNNGSGGHNMGASDIDAAYTDSQKNAGACSGLTKGACALVRVQAGQMPLGAGCTGDPGQDSGNAACLTQAEQDLLEQWIDDGQLPPVE